MKPLANPILFLSDRPEDTSGLARIARDLASLAATMPEFRVGFLGRGSQGMRKFPWTTYSYPEATGNWGEKYLAGVASDFFGNDRGIVFSNWDISRLGWLQNQSEMAADLQTAYNPSMRNWDLWGYFPVDGWGPNYAQGVENRQTLSAFNRVLASSEWGQQALIASGRPDADWLPHGIDMSRFCLDVSARERAGWKAEDVIVGCVMANQARKDFPVAFETAALLKKKYKGRFKFWMHTDLLIRYWNVYALAVDFGIQDCLEITQSSTDAELAMRYAACDATMLPSAGEGFGYPIAESQACGTACVVTDYAAGQEIVPEDCRVRPVHYRMETAYNIYRAILSPYGFAERLSEQIELKREDPQYRSEQIRAGVEHLDWNSLRHPWQRWFREGLK